MGPVAALLAMDRTTLTANLKTLERRGLVMMTVDPADRRGRLLALTDAGHGLLACALPVWADTLKAVHHVVPEPGRAALHASLKKLS